MLATLTKSKKPGKKWTVVIDGKTIHFGSSDHQDFTQHGDEERKERYITRHKKRENWNDHKSAGFWAKHLLWNKRTLKASILDLKKNHGIDTK